MGNHQMEEYKLLVDGLLPWPQTKNLMSSYKDKDRFFKILEIYQDKVKWKDRILLPIGEHLFIVQKNNQQIVKCTCGYEFGDYKQNWKLQSAILVRNQQEDLERIYPHSDVCDPSWMEIREFICPGCGTLLEVEACSPGYPITFDFCPDLEGFYQDWLESPIPSE